MDSLSTLLIISGFDPTSGAGLSRDVITARDCGVYPLSLPTVLTVQNSAQFLSSTPVDVGYIERAATLLFDEFSPAVCKVGLLPLESFDHLKTVSDIVDTHNLIAVVDPIIKPTMALEKSVITKHYIAFLRHKIITPNRKEAEILLEYHGKESEKDDSALALKLSELLQSSVVLTNGKKGVTVAHKGNSTHFPVKNIVITREIHGTGCTFSTALASYLAQEFSLLDATAKTIVYVDKMVENRVVRKESQQDYL